MHSIHLKVLAGLTLMIGLNASANDAGSKHYTIGFVSPKTGSAAATGTAFQEGIDLALDVLKEKGRCF